MHSNPRWRFRCLPPSRQLTARLTLHRVMMVVQQLPPVARCPSAPGRLLPKLIRTQTNERRIAMRRSGTGSGGGYGSRNVKHVSAAKVEPRARQIREPAVAQIGGSYGDHVTNTKGPGTGWRPGPLYGGAGYSNPVGPTNMALSGPGAGREILRSGGQGTHGSVNPGSPRPKTSRSSPKRRSMTSGTIPRATWSVATRSLAIAAVGILTFNA